MRVKRCRLVTKEKGVNEVTVMRTGVIEIAYGSNCHCGWGGHLEGYYSMNQERKSITSVTTVSAKLDVEFATR